MNADGLICPDNVPGELCIAGEGLAKEYVNDKKLTIEKFQYNEDIEQRIYKTGDRGVCVEGCIWYLGREDTQIKRRGYRIELGEIESILNSVTGIKASKVVYKDSQLLAFVVPEQDFSWEISDIETIIKGKLPQFNLPDSITILERFPENINGKIDMAKLCDYANNKIETKERLENNIEKQIAEVWRRILGLKETIIYDVDFFQCGGNSLKAVEVIAEINHLFQGLELEIKDLFLNSTIKLECSINAFCGENDTEATETDMQEWGEYTSDFALEVFAGDHFFIKSNAKTVQSLNEIIKRNI